MIKVWIPVNVEEHYIVANLFYALMVTVVGSVNVTVDFTIVYPMIYLILRIKMLKHVLQYPEKLLRKYPGKNGDEPFHDLILQCLLEHKNIIE